MTKQYLNSRIDKVTDKLENVKDNIELLLDELAHFKQNGYDDNAIYVEEQKDNLLELLNSHMKKIGRFMEDVRRL